MSRIWITLGMALLLSAGAQAQDLKPKVNEKGKVGFVDASGCEVVPCKYESADEELFCCIKDRGIND